MLDIPEIIIGGRRLSNVVAPFRYNLMGNETQDRFSSIMDNITGQFLTLLDTNTTLLKGRLGLDEKQLRNIFELTNAIANDKLHKKISGFIKRNKQSIFDTTFVANTELNDVLICLEYNDTSGLLMSGGIFDQRKKLDQPKDDGNTLIFMFLPQKPESNEQVDIKGSFVERKQLDNHQVHIYGKGDRVDFTSTYKSDDKQEFTSTETYYYIGPFEINNRGIKKIVHCWGHNPNKNFKKVPIEKRVIEPGSVLQRSV